MGEYISLSFKYIFFRLTKHSTANSIPNYNFYPSYIGALIFAGASIANELLHLENSFTRIKTSPTNGFQTNLPTYTAGDTATTEQEQKQFPWSTKWWLIVRGNWCDISCNFPMPNCGSGRNVDRFIVSTDHQSSIYLLSIEPNGYFLVIFDHISLIVHLTSSVGIQNTWKVTGAAIM